MSTTAVPDAHAHFDRAQRHFARKEYDLALREFSQAALLNPEWTAPWMSSGTILLAQGRFEECRSSMVQALQAIPESPILHMFLGDAYLNLDEFDAAIDSYQRSQELLERHGTSVEAVRVDLGNVRAQIAKALGDCYLMLEDDARAIAAYRQARDLGLRDTSLHQKLALVYIDARQYEDAEQILEELASRDPDDPQTNQLLGYLAGSRRNEETLNAALEQVASYEAQLDVAEGLLFRISNRTADMARELGLVRSDELAGVGRIVKRSQKEFQKVLRQLAANPAAADAAAEDLATNLLPHFRTHRQVLQDIETRIRTDILGDDIWNRMGAESRDLLLQALYLEGKYDQANLSSGLIGIQYCFVLEKELKHHIFFPFKQEYREIDPRQEKFKIMANYILDKINLSLGQMANVLEALREDNPHELRGSMQALRPFVASRLCRGLDLIHSDFPARVNELAINYRNCWAHGENLPPQASSECRDIVLGTPQAQGLLPRLLEELACAELVNCPRRQAP